MNWGRLHAVWPYNAPNIAPVSFCSETDIVALQAQAQQVVHDHLIHKRKELLTAASSDNRLKQAYEKLDAYKKRLQAYAAVAGFKQAEVAKLPDSKTIKEQIEKSLADPAVAIFMPHDKISPLVVQVKANVLSVVQEGKAESFQSRYFNDVYLRMIALDALRLRIDIKKNMEKEKLPAMIESILNGYRIFFSCCELLCENELEGLSAKIKGGSIYKQCKKTLEELSVLFLEIDKLIASVKYKELIIKITELNALGVNINNILSALLGAKYSLILPKLDDEQFKRLKDLIAKFSANSLVNVSSEAKPDSFAEKTKGMVDVDVPGDGSCLYYSVTLAYLLPVLNDEKNEFTTRCKNIFGDTVSDQTIQQAKEFLKSYRDTRTLYKDPPRNDFFENLVNIEFRKTVVNYIRQRRNEFEVPLSQDENRKKYDNFDNYMVVMATSKEWGGDVELRAISEILKSHIKVFQTFNDFTPEHGTNYETKMHLIFLGAHYHYLIAPKFLNSAADVSAQALSNLSFLNSNPVSAIGAPMDSKRDDKKAAIPAPG